MSKSKQLSTLDGDVINILSKQQANITDILKKNRNISDENARVFFSPNIGDLHDPFLMPDISMAIDRILIALEKKERVVIFGDYDVDGISSTAMLFRFLRDIGIECSYRLPHRVHDGYGLKNYFFDELASKNVKLVVTVDCGTRDVEVIDHAKKLGIDVIVTDHHAVPENIPTGVPILNPKRKDADYPYPHLAGAGVTLVFIHGILQKMNFADIDAQLCKYIDLAALGTVADCMPLTGENRTIATLGLQQMITSHTPALKKYVANLDQPIRGNADIIGFQIGPRINAAGRIDSPLKALHWLLASDESADRWLEEIETLNNQRKEMVVFFADDAIKTVDTDASVLVYYHEKLEHGIIGLIAGKLTEQYGKPSIVLCQDKPAFSVKEKTDKKREYEIKLGAGSSKKIASSQHLVASCRSPEWCNLMDLLDACKDHFVRYGGHGQAAGFTIASNHLALFQKQLSSVFADIYGDTSHTLKKTYTVECILPAKDITLQTIKDIDVFRPFGIGNPQPLFLIQDVTITECRTIGKNGDHLSIRIQENPDITLLYWNAIEYFPMVKVGNIVSFMVLLQKNSWNGRDSVQCIIKNIAVVT